VVKDEEKRTSFRVKDEEKRTSSRVKYLRLKTHPGLNTSG